MSTSTAPIFSNARRIPAWVGYAIAASTKIWFGTAVAVNASGYLVPVTDAAALRYVGIAAESVDNSGGAAGDLYAKVTPLTEGGHRFTQFNAVTPLQAWVGGHVFFTDDHTVALAGSTSNTVAAGKVISVDTTGTTGQVTVDGMDRAANATAY